MAYSPFGKEINVPVEAVLAFREKTTGELFCEDIGDAYRLYLPYNGVTLTADTEADSPEWASIQDTVNQPFFLCDVRFVSHDFSAGGWGDDSAYVIAPNNWERVILTDIYIRFSKFADIGGNKPVLRVWKRGGDALVCVKEVVFQDVRDLINQSEGVVEMPGLFNDAVIELRYRYADACNFDGAPITLSGGRGEYMEILLENHQPIRDINGNPLPDACTVSFIGKAGRDF